MWLKKYIKNKNIYTYIPYKSFLCIHISKKTDTKISISVVKSFNIIFYIPPITYTLVVVIFFFLFVHNVLMNLNKYFL